MKQVEGKSLPAADELTHCLFQVDYNSPTGKGISASLRPPMMNTNLPPVLHTFNKQETDSSGVDTDTGRSSTPSSDSQGSWTDNTTFRPIRGVSVILASWHCTLQLFDGLWPQVVSCSLITCIWPHLYMISVASIVLGWIMTLFEGF